MYADKQRKIVILPRSIVYYAYLSFYGTHTVATFLVLEASIVYHAAHELLQETGGLSTDCFVIQRAS